MSNILSNTLNEILLEKLYEEAYEELVADGMSEGEAEIAAVDVAIERSNDGTEFYNVAVKNNIFQHINNPTLNKIVKLVNEGMSVSSAAKQVASQAE